MGRSITCNFAVHVNLSNGKKLTGVQSCYGAMAFKRSGKVFDSSVQGVLASEQAYHDEKKDGIKVVNAEVWPQTARGRKSIKKAYAVIDMAGNISHHAIGDKFVEVESKRMW